MCTQHQSYRKEQTYCVAKHSRACSKCVCTFTSKVEGQSYLVAPLKRTPPDADSAEQVLCTPWTEEAHLASPSSALGRGPSGAPSRLKLWLFVGHGPKPPLRIRNPPLARDGAGSAQLQPPLTLLGGELDRTGCQPVRCMQLPGLLRPNCKLHDAETV